MALSYCRIWHHVSAKGVVLGKLAGAMAILLMGKHKPIYHPAADCGDYVVVTDASQVRLTGRSWQAEEEGGRVYYRHSGYPGGLKTTSIAHYLERDPAFVSRGIGFTDDTVGDPACGKGNAAKEPAEAGKAGEAKDSPGAGKPVCSQYSQETFLK